MSTRFIRCSLIVLCFASGPLWGASSAKTSPTRSKKTEEVHECVGLEVARALQGAVASARASSLLSKLLRELDTYQMCHACITDAGNACYVHLEGNNASSKFHILFRKFYFLLALKDLELLERDGIKKVEDVERIPDEKAVHCVPLPHAIDALSHLLDEVDTKKNNKMKRIERYLGMQKVLFKKMLRAGP